jgi:chemotaxis signal transduction protein
LAGAPEALGVPPSAPQSASGPFPQASQILVLDAGGHSFGLLVDRVREVLRLPASALRPDLGPATLRSPISFGVCDIRGTPHMLLDVRPLLALTDGGQALLETHHD